jgi:DNA ligase (NAD+)
MAKSIVPQLDMFGGVSDPIAEEIKDLEYVIRTLDTLYEKRKQCVHPITKKIVTDKEYDLMRIRLAKIAPDSTIFDEVTASDYESSVRKIKHNPPMTSISKANGTYDEKIQMLAEWEKKVKDTLGYESPIEDWAVMSLKRDGVAVGINYEKGYLVGAGLRPKNGVDGEDVTENIKYVEGVPTKLPLPLTCSIRGELECRISVFENLNEEAEKDGEQTFANPRNYTTGSIRQFKDPTVTKKRCLNFTAYTIENLDNPPYKTAQERALWCNKVLKIPFVRVEKFNPKSLKTLEALMQTLDYETDGMVIEVNNLEDAEQMGRHGDNSTGNPRAKIAWKPEEEYAVATCNTVRWQVGRVGKITPVAEFDGVKLAGTTVSQCTCHNIGIVKRNWIGPGAKLKIIKSGKIIPKVIDVIEASKTVQYPNRCPSCQSELTLRADGETEELWCENSAECPAQRMGLIVNYLTTLGAKGLAESVVGQMLENNVIANINDLYKIGVSSLTGIGITDRTAILTLARIWMLDKPEDEKDDKKLIKKVEAKIAKVDSGEKIKIPLPLFIQALGIPGASKGTGRSLASHFGSIEKVLEAGEKELEEVQDVGEKTAKGLYSYFERNENMIEDLLKYIEPETPKVGKLTGQTFVFTGTFAEKRDDLVKKVESLGGKVSGSVTKKTNYVVVGADAGSKEQKAIELGITMLSLEEFNKMV